MNEHVIAEWGERLYRAVVNEYRVAVVRAGELPLDTSHEHELIRTAAEEAA